MKDSQKPKVIIDRPDALSDLRKGTEWSITAFGWVVWLVLFRPVLIVGLWLLGVRQVYVHMVRLGGAAALLEWMSYYVYVIAAVGVVLTMWNLYNRLRFRRREHRRQVAEASARDLAEVMDILPHELQWLREQREVSLGFLEGGQVEFHRVGRDGPDTDVVVYGRYRPLGPAPRRPADRPKTT